MTDKNDTTCFEIPQQNSMQVLADLHAVVPDHTTPDEHVILAIKMETTDCSYKLTFFETEISDGCEGRKITGEIGELVPSLKQDKICYYKLPLKCTAEQCLLDAHVVSNSSQTKLEICNVGQGWIL